MTLSEWLLEYEHRRPKQDGDYAGGLTQGEVDRLREKLETDDWG